MKKSLLIIFLVLFFDQFLKIWVKTHLYLGEEIHIAGDWFIIHFTENPGMAFGIEFGGDYGKLALSLFRIVAVGGIGYYLFTLLKEKTPFGLTASISLIFAGALGNIIDSVFYGIIFNDSFNQLATLFPSEGGYSELLHGKVVDMLYFPLLNGHFPDWLPLWGSEHFIFFRPVFNIADSSITVGITLIILFQRQFFEAGKILDKNKAENSTVSAESTE